MNAYLLYQNLQIQLEYAKNDSTNLGIFFICSNVRRDLIIVAADNEYSAYYGYNSMEFARHIIAIYDDSHEDDAWNEKCRTHLVPNLCIFP